MNNLFVANGVYFGNCHWLYDYDTTKISGFAVMDDHGNLVHTNPFYAMNY